MFAVLIHQRVADISVWRRVFQDDLDARRAYGGVRDHVFHQESDPAEIVIMLEWDDPDRARLYSQSDDLRESLTRSGAMGQTGVWVLDGHPSPYAVEILSPLPE